MFPVINKDIEKWKEKSFSYETIQSLSVSLLKDISKTNKNFIVIIPKDFDVCICQ